MKVTFFLKLVLRITLVAIVVSCSNKSVTDGALLWNSDKQEEARKVWKGLCDNDNGHACFLAFLPGKEEVDKKLSTRLQEKGNKLKDPSTLAYSLGNIYLNKMNGEKIDVAKEKSRLITIYKKLELNKVHSTSLLIIYLALGFTQEKSKEDIYIEGLTRSELSKRGDRTAMYFEAAAIEGRDKLKSADLYEQAALKGEKDAILKMVPIYGLGTGRVQSEFLARAWFEVCRSMGVKKCEEKELFKPINNIAFRNRVKDKASFILNIIRESKKKSSEYSSKLGCENNICDWKEKVFKKEFRSRISE